MAGAFRKPVGCGRRRRADFRSQRRIGDIGDHRRVDEAVGDADQCNANDQDEGRIDTGVYREIQRSRTAIGDKSQANGANQRALEQDVPGGSEFIDAGRDELAGHDHADGIDHDDLTDILLREF